MGANISLLEAGGLIVTVLMFVILISYPQFCQMVADFGDGYLRLLQG